MFARPMCETAGRSGKLIRCCSFQQIGNRKLTAPNEQSALPLRRTLQLSRPELSAREALELVLSVVSEIGSDWFLAGLATAGSLGLDGCLSPSPNSSLQFNL